MAVVDAFGPERLPSAVVLSFDNLGEASALERGTWSADAPVGSDPSVTQALPWLLDELDRHGLSATFFLEAINCELYPDAVTEIAARGHEIGHHGWSHEHWASLTPASERDALTRGLRAFEALGLRPRGFRPPGGDLSERTPGLLRAAGIEWCSPAGHEPTVDDGLAYMPFDWQLVDAYHLMDRFASLRASHGDPERPREPADLATRLIRRLSAASGFHTLVLHPFLMLDHAWAAGAHEVLAALAALAGAGRAWVTSGGAFADWLGNRIGPS